MFDLGAGELVLIVFVVLILFGPKKLPELAQSLGRGMREFKRAQREFTEQINQAVSSEHYNKKRGPELDRPQGSVARTGSRRSGSTEGASGASSGNGAGHSTTTSSPSAESAPSSTDSALPAPAPSSTPPPSLFDDPGVADARPSADAQSESTSPPNPTL